MIGPQSDRRLWDQNDSSGGEDDLGKMSWNKDDWGFADVEKIEDHGEEGK